MTRGAAIERMTRANGHATSLRLRETRPVRARRAMTKLAIASGYRGTNLLGWMVLYGISSGFVVYVLLELANQSGFAGVLDPTSAAAGTVCVEIVIGLTVLLFKRDGRA